MCEPAPTVQLSPMNTCASITQPSPISVPFSITVYAPTCTFAPRRTDGSTIAVGWTPGARTGAGGANTSATAMQARFGSSTRMTAHGAPCVQSGGRRIAEALVACTSGTCFASLQKETSPGRASSRPAQAVISTSSPSRTPPSRAARSLARIVFLRFLFPFRRINAHGL